MPKLIDGVEETKLGFKEGAIRQYRYGDGLHIREYEDEFVIHVDKYDPRREPLKHLIFDSPEILISFGIGSLAAKNSKGILSSIISFLLFSFLSYKIISFLKRIL